MNLEKAQDQLAEYGYQLTDTFQIRKADKIFPVVVSAKGQRFYVKQMSGSPLWSGPDLGDFVKSFWYAKKIPRLSPNADSSKLEWIKGPGVDRDGHSLAWWKSKAAKWSRSEYDRPKVFIRVITWDRAGQRDEARCGEFAPDNLKGAKEFSREAVEAGGSSQIYGRIEIPYQSGVTFDIGEWKNNASNGYYVWSVDGETFLPAARNGPFENPDDAVALAKRVARGGQTYDAVITFGGDPEARDFSIWKSFKAWSGEVHYTTDLPKVGGRLREYR
jgi:hypothetical protein